MPFAMTDDRVRIYYEVHGRGALDLETVLEFLAWCQRRGRG